MSRWGRVKPWQTEEAARREERQRRLSVSEQKAAAVMEAERRALTPPAPERVTVEDASMLDFAEYKSLVAELGVDDSAIRNHELREFLSREGIAVYDYQRVVAFMDAKVKKEGREHKIEWLDWKWKPINEKYPDIGKSPDMPISASAAITFSMLFGNKDVVVPQRSTRTYARAIPHAVLLTVKKIRDRFGDAVRFYASDYEVRNPDPFLLVTGPGLDYYVIERWDEPSFRS